MVTLKLYWMFSLLNVNRSATAWGFSLTATGWLDKRGGDRERGSDQPPSISRRTGRRRRGRRDWTAPSCPQRGDRVPAREGGRRGTRTGSAPFGGGCMAI